MTAGNQPASRNFWNVNLQWGN